MVVALPALLASAMAVACPLCIGTAARSSAQDLDELSRAVLAVPDGDQYRVVVVIKGAMPESLPADLVIRDPALADRTLLLARDEQWPTWVSLGSISASHAPVLRTLAARHPPEADAAGWQRRLGAALPGLESPEALLAELSYAAAAAAPYGSLRSAKAQLDAATVRGWVNNPTLASRQSLYLLLLGIAGNASDATALEAQLDAAWAAHEVTNLASMIAADLELRGPTRVTWVEDRYLRDPARTVAEIQATLLALGVQANSGGLIPRGRVIDAYRVFMGQHPDMAGFVALDLAAWRYWDVAPEYAAILKSGTRQHFSSRAQMIAYLKQSPLGWSP
jgi:hypothetical protein